jgi:DnaJ-like protein/TIR domain-containing protein/Hsp70 protein
MPNTDRNLRVFLCHTSQDKPIVRELYQRLLSESWIDPWLDEEKLLPGQDWDMEIEKAVEAADVVIVCLSHRSVTKEGYVQRELRFALDIALEKPEGTIFIIPLKLENCEPPRKLRTWQYVEYFPPDKRDNSFRLMKVSMQERLKSLGLSVGLNDMEFFPSPESLSSRIISKKIADARQALQNDQLQTALEIYDVLVKQNLRLKEIINDLEDVSIIYSDSKKLWVTLATAYRKTGDISRAQEYEKKINVSHTHYATEDRKPKVDDYQKKEGHNLARHLQDGEPNEPSKKKTVHISETDQQFSSVSSSLPTTISVETLGGVSTPIFYKGDSLPSQIRNTFSTATDNQSQVEVHLVIGENKLATDNKSLGKFILDGIPPAPKGAPQIEIVFEVSQELVLNVRATDKSSGRTKNFQVVKLNTITPPPLRDPLPPKPDPNSDMFSDFFQTIFGLGDKGYQQEIQLTLEDAYKGTIHRFRSDDKEKLVRIPAGVRTGSKIRAAGAGPSGLDLYFIISVEPHPFFERKNHDLYMRYPIHQKLALQGGELKVPLIEKGKSLYMTIPPNTKDKSVFRLSNRGFPYIKEPKKYGDFYPSIDIYDPENIPPAYKKILQKINDHMR